MLELVYTRNREENILDDNLEQERQKLKPHKYRNLRGERTNALLKRLKSGRKFREYFLFGCVFEGKTKLIVMTEERVSNVGIFSDKSA